MSFIQCNGDFSSLNTYDRLCLNQKNQERIAVPQYSERVVLVANKALFMEHFTGQRHPEAPKRLEVIEMALKKAQLMNQENEILPREATLGEISLCHDENYVNQLKNQIDQLNVPGEDRKSKKARYVQFDSTLCHASHVTGDFNISSQTLEVSLYAAGAPLTAIEYILNANNQTKRAFCLIRPPGHHAHQQCGSGFCVFNNVAIAAKHLTQNLGFQRVVIIDWDAHHGDGTQELTERDPKIFYFSTHKSTTIGKGFYPGPDWGREDQRGIEDGKETMLNCPVSGSKQNCREQILSAFRNQLIPAMDNYQPEFVLISCGFDAHEKDQIVGLGLKDEDFHEMTLICVDIAKKYANGRIVSVLEGGYHLEAIASAAVVHVEALGKG